jgi:predicted enzyme related to lactoylglutathione lyase
MAGMNITHVRLLSVPGGLVLETDDLDGDIERLRGAGVELDGPEEAPWGRYVTRADPDGNKLVLAGPPTR